MHLHGNSETSLNIWKPGLGTHAYQEISLPKTLKTTQSSVPHVGTEEKKHTYSRHGNDLLFTTSRHIHEGEVIKSYLRNRHLLPHDWNGIPRGGKWGKDHIRATQDKIEEYKIPVLLWDRGPNMFNFNPPYEVDVLSFQKGNDYMQPYSFLLHGWFGPERSQRIWLHNL